MRKMTPEAGCAEPHRLGAHRWGYSSAKGKTCIEVDRYRQLKGAHDDVEHRSILDRWMLSGDRDMIVDNVTSSRLTLKKGRNIIRGAVINGPGMANFCVRFLDEKGAPIKNFTISYL